MRARITDRTAHGDRARVRGAGVDHPDVLAVTVRSSAAVVVARSDRPEVSSYGPWHSPTAPVCWASGTKVFVAALVRSLVAEGTLRWDTPMGDLLGAPTPGTLTVEALVTHRSGLPRVLPGQSGAGDPYVRWTDERFDSEVLPALGTLTDEPGPEPAYSNLGYAVLVRSLEIGLGTPWIDQLRARVVEPAGLPGSAVSLLPPGDVVRSRSLTGRALDDWDVSSGPFSGGGGLCSTVPDMVALLGSALAGTTELDPRRAPHAWDGAPSRWWHRGALLRSGSVLLVDADRSTVVAAHSTGGFPGRGAEDAERSVSHLRG